MQHYYEKQAEEIHFSGNWEKACICSMSKVRMSKGHTYL